MKIRVHKSHVWIVNSKRLSYQSNKFRPVSLDLRRVYTERVFSPNSLEMVRRHQEIRVNSQESDHRRVTWRHKRFSMSSRESSVMTLVSMRNRISWEINSIQRELEDFLLSWFVSTCSIKLVCVCQCLCDFPVWSVNFCSLGEIVHWGIINKNGPSGVENVRIFCT